MIPVRAAALSLLLGLAALTPAAASGSAPADHFRLGLLPSLEDSYPYEAPVSAPPKELPHFHVRLGRDLGDLARSPLHLSPRQWRNAGIAALGIGAAHLLDDELRDREDPTQWIDNVRPLGQEPGIALLGLAWLGGRSLHHHRLVWAAQDGFEAMILASGIITPVLKQVVGRERPRTDDGSESFGNGESFPSGEATQAFALAAVFARHYQQHWVDGLSWGLASLIGWRRIESDAHWASDVVAGALIGATVGHWIVGRNDHSRWSLSTGIAAERREAGVTARWRLGRA